MRDIKIIQLIFVALFLVSTAIGRAEEKPIQPAKVSLGRPTSFEKDILPIFKANCLACHSKAKNEGSLILEDYASLMKGGDSGQEIVPGKPDESYLYLVSARIEESYMPPLPNPSAAKALTPKELGILRLWIQEGAKSSGQKEKKKIVWQPIPDGLKSIYSLAVSPWARFVAVGRTNRVFVYDLLSGKLLQELNDPLLGTLKMGEAPFYPNGATHRDFVNSIAINPDGETIATGGYRNIKLWKRSFTKAEPLRGLAEKAISFSVNSNAPVIAVATKEKKVLVFNSDSGNKLVEIKDLKNESTALSISDSGDLLAYSDGAEKIKVYSLKEKKELGSFQSKNKPNALLLDSKNRHLFTAHNDGVIRQWDVAKFDSKPVFEFKGPAKSVKTLILSKDGTKLFSSGDEEYVRSWDLKTKKQLRAYKHGSPVSAISITPDDQKLATVSANGIGKIWQIKDGKILAEFQGSIDKLQASVLAIEEATIAKQHVALADAAFKAGDKKVTGREAEYKKLIEEAGAASKALPDASKKKDEAEKKKNAALSELAKVISDHKKKGEDALNAANAKKAALDKGLLAAVESKKILDASNAKLISTLEKSIVTKNKTLSDLKQKKSDDKDAKSQDEQKKVIAAAEAELKTIQQKITQAKAKYLADSKKVDAEIAKKKAEIANSQKAIDAAKKLVASKPNTAAVDKKVKAAEAELVKLTEAFKKAERQVQSKQRAIKASEKTLVINKKQLEVLKKQKELADTTYSQAKEKQTQAGKEAGSLYAIRDVLFTSDGSKIITTNGSSTIQIWDASTGKALESLPIGDSAILNFELNNDGELVSLLDNQSIETTSLNSTWNLVARFGVSGESPLEISSSPISGRVQSLDFSPDGKFLAAGTGEPSRNGAILIWDVSSGNLIREIEEAHSDTISDLEFSRDGTKILSGATDKLAKIFDVFTGKQIVSFEGHTHHVLGVSWKADSSKVATSGADNVIKTWNVVSGEVERTITGYTKQVPSVAFIGTGDNLFSGSGDKNVRLHLSTNGRVLRSFGGSTDYIYCVDTSRDGKIVVAGGAGGILRVWDGTNGKILHSLKPTNESKMKTASK